MEVNHVHLLLHQMLCILFDGPKERSLHVLGKGRRAAQLFAEPVSGLSLGKRQTRPSSHRYNRPSGCTRLHQIVHKHVLIAFFPCHFSKTLSKIASQSSQQ